MKKINRIFLRLFTTALSATVAVSAISSSAAFVNPASEETETDPEFRTISIVEGETSEYGLTNTYYVDENGNKLEPDLIPEREPRALALPSKFDLRDYGYITSVKNQRDTGSCWAHAALASAESNMIMNGIADNTIDLSEAHLTWFTQGLASMDINDPLYSDGKSLGNTDLINGAYDCGGNSWDSRATLGRGSGVQLEENTPSVLERPIVDESQRYTSYGYVVNSNDLDASDHESIKQHLMNTGALYCSYYSDDTNYSNGEYYEEAYYCSEDVTGNHAVTIVGWDDNYSKDNFKADVPPGDGAWIIKNSWGEYKHKNGYFYMSYYDASLEEITSFEIADKSTYNNIYQYDGARPEKYLTSSSKITGANIFEAENNETISAAAFYTRSTSVPYVISIYADVEDGKPTSGTLLNTQSGTIAYAGYHVVNLNTPVAVSKGTKFSVVITLENSDDAAAEDNNVFGCMALQECSNLSDCSYITSGNLTANSNWIDVVERYSSTACIKSLTRSDIFINISNFPDSIFRNYVTTFDLDSNGALSYDEIMQVSEMNLSGYGISDFSGIEYFTELAKLNCSNNPIVKLDISHNNILNDFICYGCSIELGSVMCSGFTINGLDISKVSNVQGMNVKNSAFIPSGKTMSYTYNCGRNYTAQIDLTASSLTHSYGSWSDNGDSHIKTCVSCGDVQSETHAFGTWNAETDAHSHQCQMCGGIKSEEHDFGSWTADPYFHIHICEICGITESADHVFSTFESSDSKSHTGICESCRYTEEFLHNFGDFTYLDEKSHVKSCENCNYSEIYDHNFSAWATADENSHTRFCTDCGYTETITHTYGEWETHGTDGHSRSCTDCGYTETAVHVIGEWAYSDETSHIGICADCRQVTEAEHDFSDFTSSNNESHIKICNDCGYSVDLTHNFGNWTEYDNQQHSRYCTDCGIIIYSNHNMGEWITHGTDSHSRSCTDCSYTETAVHVTGEWEYSDETSHIRICADCGQVTEEEHDFSAFTSSDSESHTKICNDCGYTVVSSHSFSDWQDNGNAERIRICTDCSHSEIEKIDYITGDINADGTIDVFDLIIARQKLHNDFLNSVEFASADVNKDRKYDEADVVLLYDFILGKIKTF